MKSFIGVGGQLGMGAGGDLFPPLIVDLNNIFSRHLSRGYSVDVRAFGFVLRVDSSDGSEWWAWHESGVKRLRLQRKRRLITADICFQDFEYVGVDRQSIREQLLNRLQLAVDGCLERMKKEKFALPGEDFEKDLTEAYAEIREKWGLH